MRPLLMASPVISNERYEDAYTNFIKAIRREFQGYKANRNNINHILWFLFNPQHHFECLELDFTYGQRYFSGKISVAWFEYKDLTIVCLPAFNNYYFITEKLRPKRSDIIEDIIRQIQVYVRNYKKDYDEELILDKYVSGKGEFSTTVDFNMFVSEEKITIRGFADDDFMRQFFRTNISFEGRFEVQKVGYDLNDMYPLELNRAYFMEESVEMLSRLIYNRDNIPLVILGKRKSGKTTLLHEVIFRYLSANADKNLPDLDNIWTIDPSRLIAGMSIIGMWQRRFESIIEFARHPVDKKNRQDKLYFNNIVALFRIGKSSQNDMTLSDVLKPYMQEHSLQVILEATPEEWDVVSELDRGFTDLFKVVRLQEPDTETTLRIISRLRSQLEYKHHFQIDNLALVRLIELQKRFHKNEVLIGSISENLHQLASKFAGRTINILNIIEEFSNRTHLNERIANHDIKITKKEFESHISTKLIGQQAAVDCLAEVLNTIKAQINNPERPFGSFLFIGPTGVGKTQAAKILADYLFTHEDSLVRFDMNEYIDNDAVSRLVGDFSNPEGQLTTKIRYNPFCVLLFDEIEKAHPDIHNLLLQVLGEGRLTDALGRTVSFCNTVIIMTSNLGAERIGKQIVLHSQQDMAEGTYEKAVKDFFRPEFINRIDKTVVFTKLTASHIGQIAGLQIKNLLKRHGFLRRHTILNVSKNVLESIAEKGFDPEMGGRALKRQIEKELTMLIADQLVEIAPDNPVIFNLYLKDGKLIPQLVSLEHVPANEHEAFPDISQIEIKAEHFQSLLKEIEIIKEELYEFDNPEGGVVYSTENTANSDYLLHIRDDLNKTENEIRSILWEYETGKPIRQPQVKHVTHVKFTRNENAYSKPDKIFFRDLYSQLKISEYFSDVYDAARRITSEAQSLFFELFQKTAWTYFHVINYIDYGVDNILVSIASVVENDGEEEVAYLKKLYGFKKEYVISKNHVFLHMQWIGLWHRFNQEVGYHLFFHSHEASLPVEVKMYELDDDTDVQQYIDNLLDKDNDFREEELSQEKVVKHIIRLYSLPDAVTNQFMLTDLRTGIIYNKPLTYNDIQFLRYANLPDEMKLPVDVALS